MAICLTMVAYECKGLEPGNKECISKLCDKHDFAILPEHWLHEGNNCFNRELSGLYKVIYNIRNGHICGSAQYSRPFGGCSILWKDNLALSVIPIRASSIMCC